MDDEARLREVARAAQRAEALEAQFHLRRKDERTPLNCVMLLLPADNGDPISAWAKDISPRGLGAFLDGPLPTGTLLTVDLRSMGKPEYTFEVRVVNCHTLAGGIHRIGMSLTAPPE